jgi:hypothetical protein
VQVLTSPDCIAAAEIGENTGLYLFGFKAGGIVIAYAMGYALAGFTTFITILGRYSKQLRPQHLLVLPVPLQINR